MAAGGLIRIGELSRRTGISVDVIRVWERRYELLRPERTEANQRLYSSDDLARLRLMQHYMRGNVPASRAAELVRLAHTAALSSHPGIPPGDVRKALAVLRESLEAFDEAPASRVLTRLLGVFTPGAVLRDVVLPYLRQVGERWECGEATVAQEHFASSFLEAWMLSMGRGWGQGSERRAILASIPGDRHALGLLAFALILHDLGWRITYLGADTPLVAVEKTAEVLNPDAIVLSAALEWNFSKVAAAIGDLSTRQPVSVGGAGTAGAVAAGLDVRVLAADPLVAAYSLSQDD